ncbi:SWIM zinc finger family protein [Streptomyces sp. NBC_00078]|uniref:SWIM zinc finger family protein n=1 Tax=Streptomyces sp. NBC_00078 TaxID=2975643 RepID=UPI0022518E2C|nr:SWIM zinc finger family protein [Streptomyces sp. NBC_00078]MCX5424740.1 SWIM zinc finger family protein [Streptomyces sp. NBC_00078]
MLDASGEAPSSVPLNRPGHAETPALPGLPNEAQASAPADLLAEASSSASPDRPGEEPPAVLPNPLADASVSDVSDPSNSPTEAPTSAPPAALPEVTDVRPEAEVGPRGGEADAEGGRPGDVAREALRAARARSRQAQDAERAAAEAGRRQRRPAGNRAQGDASRRAAGVQARELRELLADAFRMPSSAAEPDMAYDDNESAGRGSSDSEVSSTSRDRTGTAGLTGPSAEAHRPGAARTAQATATAQTVAQTPEESGPAALRASSMAAPSRDGELRRTFPAFPSRASPAPADARFAETWWGNAWVTALEEGALDAKRLARGRSYAEQGHVDAITVTPGLVLAYVQGSRPRPYRVQVRLRTLDDADWARFLDAAAERPGHIAALLDKELPQSLADCGVPLLPGPRDLDPHCSCPDRGHPCKHAAALCYQTARLLDADPFVLLLLRGRGERDLLDVLSRLSAARAARAAQEQEPAPLPGVRATEALAPRQLPLLPMPLPVPAHPEQPPVYPAAPGGPDPFALDQLATDAAARAHALLSTGRDPVAELTLWQDAVRLAAARPGSGLTAGTRAVYASLASAAGRTPAELARAVAAWRQGGAEGLAVLEDPWDPPAGRFDRARPLLLAADLPAFRPWRNHLSHPRGHVQLRLGRDGLWYAYESEPGHDDWWPRGTPGLDPVGALTGLGASPDA